MLVFGAVTHGWNSNNLMQSDQDDSPGPTWHQSPNSSFVRFMACVHGPEERLGTSNVGWCGGGKGFFFSDQPGGGGEVLLLIWVPGTRNIHF